MRRLYSLFLSTVLISCISPETKVSGLAVDTTSAATQETTTTATFSQKLQSQIDNFSSKNYQRAKARESKEEILSEASDFEEAADVLQLPYSSKEDKSKAAELRKVLSRVQKQDFPILRKNYARWTKEKVWEQNMKVELEGSNNTTLTLIWGDFADHATIKKMQTELVDVFEKLRFKRVNYKWIPHDDDYTYYDIDSKKDEEL
jgi:hypothetical protein